MTGQNLSTISPAASYQDILNLNAMGAGLTSTPTLIQDGLGNTTLMTLWSGGINFNRGIGQFQLDGVALTASAATLNNISDLANAQYLLVTANSQLASASVLAVGAGLSLVSASPYYRITPVGELGGLQAITGTGIVVRSGTGTYQTDTLTSDSTITISNPTGVAGNPYFQVNADTVVERINVQNNGVPQSTRSQLNFIPSTNIGITVNDDPSNNRANVIISATPGEDVIYGTPNQIIVTPTPPGVTLSLDPNVIITTSVTAGNLELVGNVFQANNAGGGITIAPSTSGAVALKNSTNAVPLQWFNAAGSHYVAFQAGNPGSNVTWTLPTTDSTGTQAHVSNGSGVLSWSTGGGGVASITGTAKQITASASTGNVTLSIANTYVGQTSITTLGTIGTGTWQGSIIGLAYGGTNANLTASNGGIFYSTASAGAILAGTATARQMLQSGSSTTPAWSTATWPATTSANQLLYSSSANTVAGLATANSAVLVTSSSGVPAYSSTMTNGQLIVGSTGATPTAATLTAGTNISITNGAGSITINALSGSDVVNYISTNHAASPYTALSTDYYIAADVTAGVITINLPNTPSTGRVFVVKDKVGLAGTSNITITTPGGVVTIDGATTYVMNTAYQAAQLIFNGTSYEVY